MKNPKPIKIFVYGTLLTEERNWIIYLAPKRGIKDSIEGFTIHSLGGYPGINKDPSGKGIVYGEVFEVSFEELRRIDRLEGYSPDHPDEINTFYRRIKVTTSGGVECYTYLFVHEFEDDSRIISSGDWLKYNERKYNEASRSTK